MSSGVSVTVWGALALAGDSFLGAVSLGVLGDFGDLVVVFFFAIDNVSSIKY